VKFKNFTAETQRTQRLGPSLLAGCDIALVTGCDCGACQREIGLFNSDVTDSPAGLFLRDPQVPHPVGFPPTFLV
jgi:hypothetical protein